MFSSVIQPFFCISHCDVELSRFYDIPIQRRVDQPEKRDNLDGSIESHFKFPKLMRSDKWMEFVNDLKTNLFSLHESCLEGYKTSLKKYFF